MSKYTIEILDQCTPFPSVDELDYKHVRFNRMWAIHSDVIGGWIIFPVWFVDDHESVPGFQGTSLVAGHTHDLLCRKDAIIYIIFDDPETAIKKITKKIAADAYLEIMERRYGQKLTNMNGFKKQVKKAELWGRRYGKYWIVRAAWGYFQKFNVLATYEEITGEKEIAP